MKIGSAVVVHAVVLCAFALTQGCVTSESQESGRGAGARHKGIWKHDHKGKSSAESQMQYQPGGLDYGQGDDLGMLDDPMIDSTIDVTPMPEPVAPEPAAPMTEVYIVQKGDILSQLAIKFDTEVATLVQMNGLDNPDVLYVGQELRIPAGRRSAGSYKAITKKSAAGLSKGGTYEIQKGDTLSGIAIAAGVSIDDLRALNNMKNDNIFAGEKMAIPAYGKVPSAARKPVRSTPAPQPAPEPEPAPAPAPAPLAPSAPTFEPVVEPAVVPVETPTMTVDMVQDHVVYPGETLEDIARQHGASKSEIMRMNGITDENAIRPSQRLRIPIAE